MKRISAAELERVRAMAAQLDYILEEDLQLLAGASPLTVQSWRKRGKGPAYVLLGNRFLYERSEVARYLATLVREHAKTPPEGCL